MVGVPAWSGPTPCKGTGTAPTESRGAQSDYEGDRTDPMSIVDWLNARSRKLSMFDWKLAQGAAMCVAIIAIKIFPRILDVSLMWFVALAVILYVKPLYVFYLRK